MDTLGGGEQAHGRQDYDCQTHTVEYVHLEQIGNRALRITEQPQLEPERKRDHEEVTSAIQRCFPSIRP